MKFHPLVLALAAASTPAFAENVKMVDGCETIVRSAVASLQADWMRPDETTGAVTIEKEDLAAVMISNVKVLASSCKGPADCDAQHPDAFTWGADIGKKGDGSLTGKVVVSYHRGHCWVSKLNIQ